MNKEQMLDALGYVAPALIEEAGRDAAAVKRSRKRRRRIAAIAACLCLALAGTALAWRSSRVQITWDDSGPGASYAVESGTNYFPLDSFSEEVTGLAAELRDGVAARSFDSWDSLEEYLGMELYDNPILDEAECGPQIFCQDLNGSATNILLVANFNTMGLAGISADGSYIIDGIWVLPRIQLFTELLRGDENAAFCAGPQGNLVLNFKVGEDGAETSVEEFYTTPNGLETTIVRCVSNDAGSLRTRYLAYFSMNGILYSIDAGTYPASDTPEDAGHTLEVLKKVLDGFAFTPNA